MDGHDTRVLGGAGKRGTGEPRPELVLVPGPRPELERRDHAAQAGAHAGHEATGGALVVAHQRQRLLRPRGRIAEPRQVGRALQRVERFRLVEVEVAGRLAQGDVAPAAEEARHGHPLRDVLAQVPLVELRVTARHHIVPERKDSLAGHGHGADGNGPGGSRQEYGAVAVR